MYGGAHETLISWVNLKNQNLQLYISKDKPEHCIHIDAVHCMLLYTILYVIRLCDTAVLLPPFVKSKNAMDSTDSKDKDTDVCN